MSFLLKIKKLDNVAYLKIKKNKVQMVKSKTSATRFSFKEAQRLYEDLIKSMQNKADLELEHIADGREKEDLIQDCCPYCKSKKGYSIEYKVVRETTSPWNKICELKFDSLKRKQDSIKNVEYPNSCYCLECGKKILLSRLNVLREKTK